MQFVVGFTKVAFTGNHSDGTEFTTHDVEPPVYQPVEKPENVRYTLLTKKKPKRGAK